MGQSLIIPDRLVCGIIDNANPDNPHNKDEEDTLPAKQVEPPIIDNYNNHMRDRNVAAVFAICKIPWIRAASRTLFCDIGSDSCVLHPADAAG